MANDKLPVFISWSGPLAKTVAAAIREWLPSLFDGVDPWMSDTDIASGARALDEIDETLARCFFGIIIVTDDNQNQAWLNYEAGAISKSIAESKSRVVPLLVDLSGPSQLTGPLAQFQARKLDQTGVWRLVETLAQQLGVAPDTVRARFDAFWPRLEQAALDAVEAEEKAPGGKPRQRPMTDMMEEVLAQVRELPRIIEMTHTSRTRRNLEAYLELASFDELGRELMATGVPGLVERGEYMRNVVHDFAMMSGDDEMEMLLRRGRPMRRRMKFPPIPSRFIEPVEPESQG